jgi:hypothetical protein
MALQLWSGLPLGCGQVAAVFRNHSDEQVFHNSRELTCLTNKYQLFIAYIAQLNK